MSEYSRAYYLAHKEEIKARQKAYYQAHKEKYIKPSKPKVSVTDAEKYEMERRKRRNYYEKKNGCKITSVMSVPFHVETPPYITVKEYPNKIYIIEADVYTYGELGKYQNALQHMVSRLNSEDNITIVDENSIQIYLKTRDGIQEIVDNLKEFCEKHSTFERKTKKSQKEKK